MENYFDYSSTETPAEWNLDIEQFLERSQEQQQERLEQELDQIEEQLSERSQIHRETIDELKSKLDWYTDRLQTLYRRPGGGPTSDQDQLKTRIKELYREIRQENREHWQDRQQLHRERRKLFRELEELNDTDCLTQLL